MVADRCWQHAAVPSLVAAVFAPGHLSGTTQPTLRAGSLLLRPWAKVDAPDVVGAYQEAEDPTLACAIDDSCRSGAVDSRRRGCLDGGDRGELGGRLRGRLAGRMTLKFYLGDACAGVGYWTRQADRGRGVAPQALLAATRWAFDQGFHRVQLEHSVQNRASCRVAAKAEFSEEGIRRSAAMHADGWHDMHVHGRVNTAPSATP